MSIWCGGLIALAFISRGISGKDAGTGTIVEAHRGEHTAASRRVPMAQAVLRRYSLLALIGFILVLFRALQTPGCVCRRGGI